MGRVLSRRDRMRSILRHQPAERQRRRAWRRQVPPPTGEIPLDMDFAAQRVRAAGGPTDNARYTCACGYAFDAPVSATVRCPHCGDEQAW